MRRLADSTHCKYITLRAKWHASMLPPPSKRSRRGAAQRRVLAYMDALPCAAQYETSYAHRAVVTHTVVLARAHIKNVREK